MSKPKFKAGQILWFRYGEVCPAPVMVLGPDKKPKTYATCSLVDSLISRYVEEEHLYTTEEEANNAKR